MLKKFVNKTVEFATRYKYLIIFWIIARVIVFLIRLDTDHSIFYYIAENIRNGGTLYLDAWDHKPPTIFLLALPFTYLGENFYLHRIIYSLINLGAVVYFYRFTLQFLTLHSKFENSLIIKITHSATLIFIVMSLLAGVDGNNNEIWGIAFFVILLNLGLKKDNQLSRKMFIGKYLLYSILLTLKPNFGVILLLEISNIFIKKDFWKLNIFRGLLITVFPVIYVIYFASIGQLWELWNASFAFSAGYLRMHNMFMDASEIKSIIVVTTVVLFSLGGIWKLRNMLEKRFVRMWGLIILIYYAYYLLSGTHYEYYIYILAPILAIAIASMQNIANLGHLTWTRVFLFLFTAYAIGNFVYAIGINQNMSGWYRVKDHELMQATQFIKANKREGDTCVYFGPTPTLNLWADCPPPGRFINMTNYMHDLESGMNNGYIDEFVASINDKKPRYLVVSSIYQYYNYDSRIENIYNATKLIAKYGELELREFQW